ncbi:MAG TPA: 50S ribosomal protein L23 [bacterium]|nr:50S ribosomal protein L23 [bacterium]
MKTIYQVLRSPLITEKGTLISEPGNPKVMFKVDQRANKQEIKEAVEFLFNVHVERVNTLNFEGKKRRLGKRSGKQSDWKKAIVTLKEGESIEFFEGVR